MSLVQESELPFVQRAATTLSEKKGHPRLEWCKVGKGFGAPDDIFDVFGKKREIGRGGVRGRVEIGWRVRVMSGLRIVVVEGIVVVVGGVVRAGPL